MATALTLSLVPIALLIGLGFWLRTTGFIGDDFWPHAERLGYYVLLPALFFHSLATAELGELPVRLMISVLVSSTIAVSAIMVMARRLFSVDDPAFTSLFQGSVRFNNYVGVSAAAGIFGAQGIAIAAVANAAIVPTVNILCVLVFARYGAGSRATFAGVLRQLIFNPLIMACALGISVQASGLAIPPGIEPALKTLGQSSLPLGLLCIGAALNLHAVRRWLHPIGVCSIAKFVAMPLATVLICRLFGLQGEAALAVVMFQALPTASSAYIMARQLGGDAPLMAGIIAGQTLIAALALPAVLLATSHLL